MQDPTYYLESLESGELSPEVRLRLIKIHESISKLSANPDVIRGAQLEKSATIDAPSAVQPQTVEQPEVQLQEASDALNAARSAVDEAFLSKDQQDAA
jgi:hypothetical protein